MDPVTSFLLRRGQAVLFAFVLAEQLGLPLPAVPVLLGAGALSAMGGLHPGGALGVAVLACVAADFAWYEAGRRRGAEVLRFLCRISLEPDSCVRRTEETFARHGGRTLLVAKFVPGLSTVAPPLAGLFGMSRSRFALLDAAGSLLWAGGYFSLGYMFSAQIEQVARSAGRLGAWLLALLGGALAVYVALKYVQRQRFLRELRVARITPEELQDMLAAGEDLVVVDLRHRLDFEADPETIPGAVRLDPADIERDPRALPPAREVVLYCT